MTRRGSLGRLAFPLRGRRRTQAAKKKAPREFKIPGIPAEIAARLLDLKDELHLEPVGDRWLARALVKLGLVDTPSTRRRAR